MTSTVPSVEDFTNAFPNHLTPIVGEPTYQTLKELKDQLKANAASIPTTLGGGNHGNLGLILSPAAYTTISPTAFVEPAYPGQHPAIPAGTNAANTSAIIRRHTEDTRQWREFKNVSTAPKIQLLSAVDDIYVRALRDRHVGYMNQSIRTTQWGASVGTFPMRKHLKSRNPALNIPRRHEAVATDTVYSDTSAVDSGVKQAQLFVGKEYLVSDIYPMRSGKQFINTLEDNIRRCGAMDKLISDSAKNEISHKVKDILRAYNISDWQSEPHHQNQNPAEWRYRTIKAWTNTIMNRTGAPAYCWLLTLQYVCYILNHISTGSLGGQVPLQVLYGITPDISIMLLYTFYQPIFYATHDQHYPSESEERAGYWVGFAEHSGDSLTHKVLDAETLKIIHRSALRPRTPKNPNRRLVDDGGEEDHQPHERPTKNPTPDPSDTPTVYIKSRHDDGPTSSKPLPEFNPEDLVGRTFLLPPGDNGERLRAKVTRKVVEDIEKADGERVQKLSYILGIGNGKVEELISYNQLVDHLEAAANEDNEINDDLFKFQSSHRPPGATQANRPQLERM